MAMEVKNLHSHHVNIQGTTIILLLVQCSAFIGQAQGTPLSTQNVEPHRVVFIVPKYNCPKIAIPIEAELAEVEVIFDVSRAALQDYRMLTLFTSWHSSHEKYRICIQGPFFT